MHILRRMFGSLVLSAMVFTPMAAQAKTLEAVERPETFRVTLVSSTTKTTGGALTVKLGDTDHLPELLQEAVGDKGETVTLNFDSGTRFVRRFNGTSSLSEFKAGDTLLIRAQYEYGRIDIHMVKNIDIWVRGVSSHTVKVHAIDTTLNTITVVSADLDGTDTKSTVKYDNSTLFTKEGSTTRLSESDLKVGGYLRVRGMVRQLDGGALVIERVKEIFIK